MASCWRGSFWGLLWEAFRRGLHLDVILVKLLLGICRGYYRGLYRGYVGIMEKKMETTV